MKNENKEALPSITNTTIRPANSSAQLMPTFNSYPGLSEIERQLLNDKGLLPDDLEKLNIHLINKACDQLANHNPVAAMIARLAPWMEHGPGQRDVLTAAEILDVLSEMDRSEHFGAV